MEGAAEGAAGSAAAGSAGGAAGGEAEEEGKVGGGGGQGQGSVSVSMYAALTLPLIPPCTHANRSALPLCLGNHARAGESNNAKAYVLAIILEWEHSHII